ncbi:hypothetical protein COS31_04180 [Candidatus Roizmanbacteria bacterium CG02_land_8_20_14_3_00_36_15]|uniref:Uncharacterized protein n=2 Tax=Candidatus Roizmaniibacteriota TaxID=1752723 RepID=A0A2M8KKR1_9BACT|nr:MAG: hypothetical protein COS51_04280 [Candidatus Roizmanbacteria bacterium CG03_land_8_20_14_0_80_36_21]PIV37603.1 MAG: hypothetical protein COS31_04180 [Candidatus Roizmanbacteria bacterium CG02_land_8_20_14_3_00_36_15]PIY69684.1 MAG: hypothetical protein COY89_05030 [Candidatus Roizmanbacteria bacterium CG_4_10_14_0_8_um_filter_36_36]PJA52395.1 MAG: hypothetical protein CO166_06170 [Candidatus Roizmanbacteria bacterium CG_4_9_14_3_um_filter_36_11]PJC81923.1 MAG: hypothetical protein CO007
MVRERKLIVEEIENLKMVLSKYRIDTSGWGQGTTKTVENLLEEILKGESILVEDKNGLLRVVRYSRVYVYYIDGDHEYQLIEDRQEFANGKVRRRGFKHLSEKCILNQPPQEAAREGVVKELSITTPVHLKYIGQGKEAITRFPSYPGLKSYSHFFNFKGYLDPSQYSPAGYQEVTPKKTTYFVWKQIK